MSYICRRCGLDFPEKLKKGICDICRASLESLNEQIEAYEKGLKTLEVYICKRYKKHICRCGGEIWYMKEGKKITFYCNNIECDYIQELDSIEGFL